jgi:hypothetical protein
MLATVEMAAEMFICGYLETFPSALKKLPRRVSFKTAKSCARIPATGGADAVSCSMWFLDHSHARATALVCPCRPPCSVRHFKSHAPAWSWEGQAGATLCDVQVSTAACRKTEKYFQRELP